LPFGLLLTHKIPILAFFWKLVIPVGGTSYVRTKFTKFPSQMMDILSYYLPNQWIIYIIYDILVKYQQWIQKFKGFSAKSDEECAKNSKGMIKYYLNTENSICLNKNYFWTDFVNNRLVFSFHINIWIIKVYKLIFIIFI
jgi:hypothetical protein